MPSNPHEDDECTCEVCEEANVIHDPGPLADCYASWCGRLNLVLREDAIERLAQEAHLYIITRD